MSSSSKILWIAIFILIGLGHLYNYAYSPVSITNGVKSYSPLFAHSDVFTYSNYAHTELEGRSFFEWYLKLDLNTLSLVYFSWIHGLLSKFPNFDIYLNSLLLLTAFIFFSKSSVFLKDLKPIFLAASIVGLFSVVVYMQTFTKECIIIFLTSLCFYFLRFKKIKSVIFVLILLALVRVYSTAGILAAISLTYFYRRLPRKYFLFGLLTMVVMSNLIFTHFWVNLGSNNLTSYGFYRYFQVSLPYFGFLVAWLPTRIAQNIAEPWIALIQLPVSELIWHIAILLDALSALTIIMFFLLFWRNRKSIRLSSQDSPYFYFLAFYTVCHLTMSGILPIVHFRYLVPILPALGLMADVLRRNIKRNS